MSINNFYPDLTGTLFWTQHNRHHDSLVMENHHSPDHNHRDSQHPNSIFDHPNTSFNFNLNKQNSDDEAEDTTTFIDDRHNTSAAHESSDQQQTSDKEPMFEKSLTPSDVGKLNRLVIPKQHAEKYFPLGGVDSSDKGLLLSFEDESGKCWRFRYSYWNSSQSYVLTKGWSRYVKEKRLDAGDVVFFERNRTDGEMLFIGWRRRSGGGEAQDGSNGGVVLAQDSNGNGNSGSTGGWTRRFYSAHPYPVHDHQHHQGHHPYHHHHHNSVPYQPGYSHAGYPIQSQAPAVVGNSKILRLFGVNMECQTDDSESDPSTPVGSSALSGLGPSNHPFLPHMDCTFSQDVNKMRNRRDKDFRM